MDQYYTYILLCDQKTFYVGVTADLKKRLSEHRTKLSFYTKQFSNIQFTYFETYPTLVLSRRREKQLKGWSHAKKAKYIEQQLKASTELVEVLAGMRSLP
jgi:putative endonuclease